MIDIFLLSFATLFVVIDPIGLAPITVSLLHGHDYAAKRRILYGSGVIAFLILLIFGLIGEQFLHAIGIGMPAFQISGGALLFLTAIEMLFDKRNQRRAKGADADGHENHIVPSDPMVFPLAMPLLAGPGAMTSMILLIGKQAGDYSAQATVFVTLGLVILLTVLTSLATNRFAHLMGDTAIQLVNRIFGMLLAALAVQFMADGILAYIEGASS